MIHIKLFEDFLNEDGYGRADFIKKKNGKFHQYYFKIEGEEDGGDICFVLGLGKLSRITSIESPENSYAVLSVEPIKENVMDDFLVKDSDYKSREDETFTLTRSEFLRFYKIAGECIKDYLQNNPKVSTIYDELPLNIQMDMDEYTDLVKSMIDIWSYEKWGTQKGSENNTLLYNKRDHD
jgi:hypothetical protein